MRYADRHLPLLALRLWKKYRTVMVIISNLSTRTSITFIPYNICLPTHLFMSYNHTRYLGNAQLMIYLSSNRRDSAPICFLRNVPFKLVYAQLGCIFRRGGRFTGNIGIYIFMLLIFVCITELDVRDGYLAIIQLVNINRKFEIEASCTMMSTSICSSWHPSGASKMT